MSYGARFWLVQDLFKSLREYICDMGGETNIELLTEDSIQFDTKNLTIVAIVKCSREDQFSEQDLQELVRQ